METHSQGTDDEATGANVTDCKIPACGRQDWGSLQIAPDECHHPFYVRSRKYRLTKCYESRLTRTVERDSAAPHHDHIAEADLLDQSASTAAMYVCAWDDGKEGFMKHLTNINSSDAQTTAPAISRQDRMSLIDRLQVQCSTVRLGLLDPLIANSGQVGQ